MAGALEFEDETFRDAPESLWATRMKTESMLGIAPTLDGARFAKACVTRAAAFETTVMYLFEDAWGEFLSVALPNAANTFKVSYSLSEPHGMALISKRCRSPFF